MRVNTLITLGASVACAGLAIVLARGWIDEAVRDIGGPVVADFAAPAALPGTPVVVAASQMAFGTPVTPDLLQVVDFPEGSVPEGALASVDMLFSEPGARIVALGRINAGEPVLNYKVSLPGSRAVLSEILPEGKRAATIRVSDVQGVAGFVLPGDLVDIVFVRDEEGKSRYGIDIRADVLLQGVRVLGINQVMDDQVEGALLGTTVTLEVDLDDAQKLALASQVGTLSLVLRPVGDESVAKTASVERERLLTTPAPARPAPRRRRAPKPKAGEPVAKVTVVRGEESERVAVVRERPEPAPLADASATATLAGGQP